MAKILIVDDSPLELKIIRKLLGEEYIILEATSGQQAIDLAHSNKPDLILLDIVMPLMDGFTVCRRLKASPVTAAIPVIFITSVVDSRNVVRGFEAGGQDYITKPFYAPELYARVKVHLELKKSRERLEEYAKELEAKNEHLNKLLVKVENTAKTDYLTGLANRWSMTKQIKAEALRLERNTGKVAMILADIDNFKKINDTYGHDCGDYVLREVAGVMKKAVRAEDVVARWGGEEFLLMLPGLDSSAGGRVAEKIRSMIEEYCFQYGQEKFAVTVTLGVAELTRSLGFDNSIKNADQALYQGKNTVKNCVVIYNKES